MFIITNRELHKARAGLDQFGSRPNREGPNELRMVEVTRSGRGWKVEIIPDELTKTFRKQAGIDSTWLRDMGFDPQAKVYGSVYVAKRLLDRVNPRRPNGVLRANTKGRNLLLFVHGYNNDMNDVVARAAMFEKNFNVEVVAFSWPANGGGATGAAAYLSDKHDARISVGALDRTLAKIGDMMERFNAKWIKLVQQRADVVLANHPKNEERRREKLAELAQDECPFTVNLLLHSMGNYLYKHLLLSTASLGSGLTFDNVILAAADANNREHAVWVDRIKARGRVFVTINEKDFALRISRMKLGEEQLARLGHFPFDLNADNAVYVDFTGATHVGDSHAYFEGKPLTNPSVKAFFRHAINGEFAERTLPFDEATGMYRMSQDRRSARKA